MYKLLIYSLAGVLLAGASTAHALQVTLDRTVVPLNETVRMELRSNYSQDLDQVDLSAVQRDFDIAGSSSQSEFSMVNGRTESVQKLTLTLVPTAVGEFQIPALQHKGRTSDPLSIKVVPAVAPPGQLQDQSIRVEAELDKPTALVNEQVIYTFRVIYRIDLNSAEITKLNVPGAQVEALPEANFQRSINGQTYQVVEKRYALFFAEAGNKTIAGQQLSAVIGASRNRFAFGFGLNSLAGGKQIKLGAEPLQLDVKPIPPSERGKAWLPAQSVELLERWSSANDNAVVGQPLTRSIEILAKGASGEQLPAAAPGSVDNLNSYPEKPAFTSEPWHGGIAGKRIDTYALIPTQAGLFTLPEVEVQWWNTQTGRAEVARLPARTFSVAAAPAGGPKANNGAASTATDLLPAAGKPEPGVAATAAANATQNSQWRSIALFAMAGWLLSLLALAGWIIRLRHKLLLPGYVNNNANNNAHNNSFGTAVHN
ncbi:MAG: protein BatD, partial [Pseudomonadales bacterium]|nr:protein BatD [Pseudomonadales bacterium]